VKDFKQEPFTMKSIHGQDPNMRSAAFHFIRPLGGKRRGKAAGTLESGPYNCYNNKKRCPEEIK
jgi:hypothetical protein